MDLIRFLLARSGAQDHVFVFERFRLVLESLVATRQGRTAPRIVNPFDWGAR